MRASCMDVRFGPKNWYFWTVVLEKTLESPLDCKEIQPVHPKGDQSWVFIGRPSCWSLNSNTLATWCEELTHLKRPWCWERLKAAGEGDDRGWNGWMASLTRWTWVWVDSGSWWWTGRPGVPWFMGSQRVGHDWVTELNWTEHEIGRLSKADCLQHGWASPNQLKAWLEQKDWPSLGQEDPLEEGMALQYSCLENPMNRGAWWAIDHGVTKSWTWLK